MAVVLIVEDERMICALAESMLNDAKHQTMSAANPEDAIALLQSDHRIDVLFTDLLLDGNRQGGIDLTIAARKLRPGLSVLYTTGQYVTGRMAASFVEPHGFLEKPYNTDQLTMALDNSLRQRGRLN